MVRCSGWAALRPSCLYKLIPAEHSCLYKPCQLGYARAPWQRTNRLPTSRSRAGSGNTSRAANGSEATLMERFAISRMTAHRSLRELAAEGLVTRVQGSGTRVAQLHRISSQLV